MPTSTLSSFLLALLLAVPCASSWAASFLYQVPAKGLLSAAPAAPAAGAGGGIEFLHNGAVITALPLMPGTEVTLTIRNASLASVSGFLTQSVDGFVRADMTRTTCSQNAAGTTPLVLAPGASCQFVLMEPAGSPQQRPDDLFYLHDVAYAPLSAPLALPGRTVTPDPGGDIDPI
jgi:hypothetical protein